MTRSRFPANVTRSAQGQLTTGSQLQPEEAQLSPGCLHCQCWQITQMKGFFLPAQDWNWGAWVGKGSKRYLAIILERSG